MACRSDLRTGLLVISESPAQGRHEASDKGVPEPDGGRGRDVESVRRYAADGIAKAGLEQLGEVASTRMRGHRTDAFVVHEGEVVAVAVQGAGQVDTALQRLPIRGGVVAVRQRPVLRVDHDSVSY